MAQVVVILDFDKTIIDCDSDNWVVDHMGLTHLFNQLVSTLPWNSIMDRMMNELHSRGKTIEDIRECLREVPMNPRIVSAIRSAHASGCDLRILSDANVFFIETILKNHGVLHCFSEITTNPSFVDEHGRFRILPYHDHFNSSPHHCTICPLNMCKGLVMERIRARLSEEEEKHVIIYLGDGEADFCAGLTLGEGDFLMPRKNFPVWEAISKNPSRVKAKVCEWSEGEELETTLLKLVSRVCTEETHHHPPVDCKFQTSSISAHNGFTNTPCTSLITHQNINTVQF